MTIRPLLCAILLLPSLTLAAAEAPLSRIAFGSCANEKRKDQPVWDAINRLDPQLFIFTGDNVYADSGDPAVLRTSYEKFASVPGFAALRENCPILATWDDHDYGLNDGGAEWEGKQAAKDAFMEFFRTPADSPLRSREGIYDAKVFGPEGRRLQVILLDTRWFRGPLERLGKEEHSKLKKEKGPWNGPYLEATDSTSTMIGEDQWKWLAAQLKVPAELRLIVSSIQVVPLDHGWEKWGNLPRERQRLLELVRDNATGVIFLSGDRHTADISMIPPETGGGPLYHLRHHRERADPDRLLARKEPLPRRRRKSLRQTKLRLGRHRLGRKRSHHQTRDPRRRRQSGPQSGDYPQHPQTLHAVGVAGPLFPLPFASRGAPPPAVVIGALADDSFLACAPRDALSATTAQ